MHCKCLYESTDIPTVTMHPKAVSPSDGWDLLQLHWWGMGDDAKHTATESEHQSDQLYAGKWDNLITYCDPPSSKRSY